MNVCVLGLWHLGSVSAACVASLGHRVVGCDADHALVSDLAAGKPPVGEPGLTELLREAASLNRLTFTSDLPAALCNADLVWVCFDTPVDDDDSADVALVLSSIESTFPYLADGTVVLISSQLPVGSTALIEQRWAAVSDGRTVSFACSPENLRLGMAIETFLSPDRIVVGIREGAGPDVRQRVRSLFGVLAERIVWMSVESAEVTKHAVNAFLATSVTFINEVARLCEAVGADAGEVERGLKTEGRIGPKAYLGPGAAFAGGTLARDVEFLRRIGDQQRISTALLDGLAVSNHEHRTWPLNRLESTLGNLAASRIAIWGLTYKPGTTTLRRSDAVALCHQLRDRGAEVRAHDPSVTSSCAELANIDVVRDPIEAAADADALVVATAWPQYRHDVSLDALAAAMRGRVVVDANRFLVGTIGLDRRFDYFSVGRRN